MIRAIVTDIEGTTSSISFVHDVLFPYAKERLPEFVRHHADEPDVMSQLNDIRLQVGKELTIDDIIAQLIKWIEEDKKITPLKALQGMIWEAGYRQGDFTGHMYDDAVEYLRKWHEQGVKLYVFSSGSVKAQKLLFGYSDAGDLTPLFSGYFDTRIGNKREADAYNTIVKEIALPAEEIMFLSDIKEELDAAKSAGMQTKWLVRGQVSDDTAEHQQCDNFAGITLE
ncbi:MAG: acireductone synthase [Gammaproteobacteria bacterium]|nr:acireductone synthase [Gammaproteobacteria bacterium]